MDLGNVRALMRQRQKRGHSQVSALDNREDYGKVPLAETGIP